VKKKAFECMVDEISLKFDDPMKTKEKFFPRLMPIMLYKVFLIFESVDEIFKCDHSM